MYYLTRKATPSRRRRSCLRWRAARVTRAGEDALEQGHRCPDSEAVVAEAAAGAETAGAGRASLVASVLVQSWWHARGGAQAECSDCLAPYIAPENLTVATVFCRRLHETPGLAGVSILFFSASFWLLRGWVRGSLAFAIAKEEVDIYRMSCLRTILSGPSLLRSIPFAHANYNSLGLSNSPSRYGEGRHVQAPEGCEKRPRGLTPKLQPRVLHRLRL